MDCDIVQILPEIGELFDAVTPGRDGAIGSRFAHESVMINYPFFKTLCNRVCHLLHGISKTLKLYSAEIFKCIAIEERHFAANAEQTEGAAGRLRHRGGPGFLDQSDDRHGSFSFRIVTVAPSYLGTLVRALSIAWRGRRRA